jgi:hypothetical protein
VLWLLHTPMAEHLQSRAVYLTKRPYSGRGIIRHGYLWATVMSMKSRRPGTDAATIRALTPL